MAAVKLVMAEAGVEALHVVGRGVGGGADRDRRGTGGHAATPPPPAATGPQVAVTSVWLALPITTRSTR